MTHHDLTAQMNVCSAERTSLEQKASPAKLRVAHGRVTRIGLACKLMKMMGLVRVIKVWLRGCVYKLRLVGPAGKEDYRVDFGA